MFSFDELRDKATPWLTFYFDRPAMSLPWRGHNPNARIPDDIEDRLVNQMRRVGARYLVLVHSQRQVGRSNYGPFIDGLMYRRTSSPHFRLAADLPDGVVYELAAP